MTAARAALGGLAVGSLASVIGSAVGLAIFPKSPTKVVLVDLLVSAAVGAGAGALFVRLTEPEELTRDDAARIVRARAEQIAAREGAEARDVVRSILERASAV